MTVDITENKNDVTKHRDEKRWSRVNSSINYYRCFQNYYHAHNHLNPNPKYINGVKATVNHWQLRDLIQVDQSSGDLYYSQGNSIRIMNLRDTNDAIHSRQHVPFTVSPKCFNQAEGGAMVTGGLVSPQSKAYSEEFETLTLSGKGNRLLRTPKGIFTFYSPETGQGKVFKLGDLINNAVTIYPLSTSQYKSYVCNNDSYLYVVDINNADSITLTHKINCEVNTSLNNVCRSPTNEKLLTVMGDSSSVFLVDPTSNSKIRTIHTDHDSGFGISFHPYGNMFATTFQDGTCTLFDIRNLDYSLAEIKSTRAGHQAGAFRCCKFSNSTTNDSLVILEHVGRVHLFDLRHSDYENTDNHQVIVFPYALDQFGDYKSQVKQLASKITPSDQEVPEGRYDSLNDENETVHEKYDIYGGSTGNIENEQNSQDYLSGLQFTAPLVYDYDYLTNINPKLFKNFIYQTPASKGTENSYILPPEFNYPQWNSSYTTGDSSAFGGPRASFSISPEQRLDYPHESSNESRWDPDPESVDSSFNSSYDTYYQESFQNSLNHIQGEMEVSGIAWYDKQLLIGCADGGVLCWDVNILGRRSFGSFSYI